MTHDEPGGRPAWRSTGDAFFPAAVRRGDAWWVLRINSFPDHPLWTLFVNGVGRFDIDEVPSGWGRTPDRSLPPIEPDVVHEVLRPLRGFVAYGSEVGRPCDNPFCCG